MVKTYIRSPIVPGISLSSAKKQLLAKSRQGITGKGIEDDGGRDAVSNLGRETKKREGGIMEFASW